MRLFSKNWLDEIELMQKTPHESAKVNKEFPPIERKTETTNAESVIKAFGNAFPPPKGFYFLEDVDGEGNDRSDPGALR